MKNLFKHAVIIFGILILLITAALTVLIWTSKPKATIVTSALSPDSALVASKTTTSTPPTEPNYFDVTLQNRNQLFSTTESAASVYLFDKTECRFDFEMRWEANDVLAIIYPDTATINLTTNKVQLGGRTVTIRLDPIPRSQWSSFSDIKMPPCSSPKLKTIDWETPLE